MVKTGQFTTKCKGNKVIGLKQQISRSPSKYFARRLTEPMAALTTEVTLKRDKAFFAYRMSFDKSTSLTAGYKLD